MTFGRIDGASAQLVDSLNAYPPRWALLESDCDARIVQQTHDNDPAATGGRCELVSLSASHGSQAILIYPIEPVRVIDELTATLRCKSLEEGIQIGFRVRFPNIVDPVTRRSAAALLFGSSYRRTGEFQRLGISNIERPLNLKRIALRQQFGAAADVRSVYVDAVVLNAYTGPGTSTLRLDELRVDSMVPLASDVPTTHDTRGHSVTAPIGRQTTLRPRSSIHSFSADRSSLLAAPFPLGRVTRIFQHNGEPLAWIRSLGFDAVWTSAPPTASLLSEAIAARVRVYAAPPTAPNPKLQPLLEPVAGWVIASDLPVDLKNEADVLRRIELVRELPSVWQRPLIACPVENHRVYGASLDAAVLDAPPRVRDISSDEVRRERLAQIRRLGEVALVVGVSSSPNEAAMDQADSIARSIGSSQCESFGWQAMWRQVSAALADRPDAILYRSQTPLTQGTLLQQNRAMGLSYVNRFVAMLESWIADTSIDPVVTSVPLRSSNSLGEYQIHRLVNQQASLLVCVSEMARNDLACAGDGGTLQIDLPPGAQRQFVWRLTGFAAERLDPQSDSAGSRVEIISPDFVEVLLLSNDPAQGGLMASSATRFLRQASLDRLQLAKESMRAAEFDWQQAAALRLFANLSGQDGPPSDLLQVAQSTIGEAETLIRSGSPETGIRLVRRADAWIAKSRWLLADALQRDPRTGDRMRYVSSPPLIAGNLETQVSWSPLLWQSPSKQLGRNVGSLWSPNLLPGGDFEREDALSREGWTFGRRHSGWVQCDAIRDSRGAHSGRGVLSIRATPNGDDTLPGGYEGTCMFIKSPPIRVAGSVAVRIRAKVKTLGFQDPHQGLLFYDSIGTQSLGVLMKDCKDWTPVTLYRQLQGDQSIHVMLEMIGAGEVLIDNLEVSVWQSEATAQTAMMPETD